MIYGNKLSLVILFLSFFLMTGCSNQNFSYELYDGYSIRSIDNTVKLYKEDELFKINDLEYQIQEFKYNSDVVCLKLTTGEYYMIYYVDSTIYGPYTIQTLNSSIEGLSMTFSRDFVDVHKAEGKIYE